MALTLSGISHHFGSIVAVNDASLAVRDGEIVCLFGPSGCGKTTLLRIAAGLEPLQAGAVRIDGEAIAEPGRGGGAGAPSYRFCVPGFCPLPPYER